MEWDPQTFLPEVREWVIPHFDKLKRYGQSRVALDHLQSVVASLRDNPTQWFHNIHFLGNMLAYACTFVMLCFGAYQCFVTRARQVRDRRAAMLETAIRTALNGTVPPPLYPRITYPASTYYDPHAHAAEFVPLLRYPSYSNLTSVSERPKLPAVQM